MSIRFLTALLGTLLVAGAASTVLGDVTVYEEGEKKIEIGGRVQLQYLHSDIAGEATVDEFFFRRLRPYILGTLTENWLAKIQFDFGKSIEDDEVAVKDAYMQYRRENFRVTIGNAKHGFSREFLTSSKRQQLVERSFVGDHNFGTPDRILGVKIDGHGKSKKITYLAGVGSASHDPNVLFLDFDTPANERADWNDGRIVSGRVDFHPLGYMAYDQGDFRSEEWKVTVGGGFFVFRNDGDKNTYTDDQGNSNPENPNRADLDRADGFELSAGVRGRGFSADVEYQRIDGETVVSDFTGGIYEGGETDIDKLALEAGYMVADNFEIVAGWDSFDADTYEDAYTRTSIGLNYFVNKHKLKFQATYRMAENLLGVSGVDSDSLFVQAQFVF